jgi:prephenate dehydrogenase
MSNDGAATDAKPIDAGTRPTRPGHREASSAGSPTGGRIAVDEMTARPSAAEIDPARAAAVARLPSRIAFLGFGLIGGSIAMALREAGYVGQLVAWTPAGSGPGDGVRREILDQAVPTAAAAIDGAGLVVLAGPPLAVLAGLDELAETLRPHLADGATVTDVASTKGLIVARARALGLPFVGGHPMAGRERSGVAAATADLFVDRPWVIGRTEDQEPAQLDLVEALASATGARPIRMTAEEHDAAVASISHLPLVVAAALVESVAGRSVGGSSWPLARRLAATGWSDMTRLAKGDPEMGAGILATNADAVITSLRDLRNTLDTWIELLEAGAEVHAPDVQGRLRAARTALDAGEQH